jgi:uncharacterized protein (TIGR02301 family)
MSPRIIVLCLLVLLQGPAVAQTPPSYEAQLLRLSELMGALHYLRGLCGASDAPAWRDRMSALIDGEESDLDRKAKLAGAFNRGYRTFSETYRTCNREAGETIRAYLDEGARIARDVGARYAD